MKCIKVWCAYNFGGSFGSNNNQNVFAFADRTSPAEIEKLVRGYLVKATGVPEEALHDELYDWEYITVGQLK